MHRRPSPKVLVGQKETSEPNAWDTINDERLENHQSPGIFEGHHGIVSEKKIVRCWAALYHVCRMTWGKGTSNFLNTPSANSLTL